MHGPLEQYLEGYLTGTLLPAERRELETHVGGCGKCRETLAALEGSTRDLRLLRPPAEMEPGPAPGFFLRVMRRIEQEREVPFWTLLIDPGFGRRLVFACLMLLAFLGSYVAVTEPFEPLHLPEAVLAGRPVPGSPWGTAPQFGPNLNRNRTAVLATLAEAD